ncbi:hypothetical protein CHU98_g11743 [Xylaria longipes]|nr:hypothetical protein CHU98_g11743 [Xylaria longipes]
MEFDIPSERQQGFTDISFVYRGVVAEWDDLGRDVGFIGARDAFETIAFSAFRDEIFRMGPVEDGGVTTPRFPRIPGRQFDPGVYRYAGDATYNTIRGILVEPVSVTTRTCNATGARRQNKAQSDGYYMFIGKGKNGIQIIVEPCRRRTLQRASRLTLRISTPVPSFVLRRTVVERDPG